MVSSLKEQHERIHAIFSARIWNKEKEDTPKDKQFNHKFEKKELKANNEKVRVCNKVAVHDRQGVGRSEHGGKYSGAGI